MDSVDAEVGIRVSPANTGLAATVGCGVVGVGKGVAVGAAVSVASAGVAVEVAEGVEVGGAVTVSGVGVGAGVAVRIAVGVGAGVGAGVAVGAGVGVDGATTMMLPAAMLLVSSGSTWFAVTLALSVIVPVVEGSIVTWTVIVALSPLVKLPRLHWTMSPDVLQLPWVGVAETKLSPAGRASVSITPVVSKGPLLATVRL